MIIKGKNVIGLKVLTINDGTRIGEVKDLIYDPKDHKMKALLLNEGGLLSSTKVVLIEDVRGVGKDAVMIENADAVRKSKDVEDTIAHIAKDDQYLTRTRIVTETGNELGKVTDIFFDTVTGVVEQLEVSQGAFGNMRSGKKHVRIDQIVSIGPDATIVRGFTEGDFSEQANQGGIQGAFHSAKEGVKGVASNIGDGVKNDKDVLEDSKVHTTLDSLKDTTNTIQESAQHLVDKAQDEFRQRRNKMDDDNPKDEFEQQAIKARLKSRETLDNAKESSRTQGFLNSVRNIAENIKQTAQVQKDKITTSDKKIHTFEEEPHVQKAQSTDTVSDETVEHSKEYPRVQQESFSDDTLVKPFETRDILEEELVKDSARNTNINNTEEFKQFKNPQYRPFQPIQREGGESSDAAVNVQTTYEEHTIDDSDKETK